MKKKVRNVTLDATEQLIYDLVMGQKRNITVKLSAYVSDLLQHEGFCQKVKSALNRSGYMLLDEDIKMDSTEIYWTFVLKNKNK